MESSLGCQAEVVPCPVPLAGTAPGCGSCSSASPRGGSSRDSSEGRISPCDTACTNALQKLCPLAFFPPFLSEENNYVCPKLALSTLYKFLIHCNHEQRSGELTASSSPPVGQVFPCGGNMCDMEPIPRASIPAVAACGTENSGPCCPNPRSANRCYSPATAVNRGRFSEF